MTQMQAALFEKPGAPLSIEEIRIAEPGPGQVRVAVKHCGCCHSDLSIVNGSFPSPAPIVLGHEAAGIVESCGEGVTLLAPGDPVVLTPAPPCGRCYGCVRGQPGTCSNVLSIITNSFPDGSTGLSRDGDVVYRGLGVGAFAQYVVTAETGAVKVAPDVPLDVACVIGCAVQTGVGAALNTARVEPGSSVLVLGLGGIGLSVVQGARIAGAASIIVSDPVPSRRETALALGATEAVDPGEVDLLARAQTLPGGGFDYAFEAAGSARLVEQALAACRPGGMTVCVGAPPIDEEIRIAPPALFTMQEKKLVGCVLGSSNSLREIPRLVGLYQAGRLDLDALITQHRPLEDINAAMDDLTKSVGIRTVIDL